MWTSLQDFAQWYKKSHYPVRPPQDSVVTVTDISTSSVVYRNANYQVELYMVKPNTNTPTHGHPGVENLIMYISGDINYVHNGTNISLDTQSHTPVLKDGDTHALFSGPRGAVFYSIEKWPEQATPSSLVNVWDGPAVGAQHEKIRQST